MNFYTPSYSEHFGLTWFKTHFYIIQHMPILYQRLWGYSLLDQNVSKLKLFSQIEIIFVIRTFQFDTPLHANLNG